MMSFFFCCVSPHKPEHPHKRQEIYRSQQAYAQQARHRDAARVQRQRAPQGGINGTRNAQAQRPREREAAPVQRQRAAQGTDKNGRNFQAQRVRDHNTAPAQRHRNTQPLSNGNVTKPTQVKLKVPTNRDHQDHNAAEGYEMQRIRRRDAIEAARQPAPQDGFIETPTEGPKNPNRLSKPFEQCGLDRTESTKTVKMSGRLSRLFDQSELHRADSKKSANHPGQLPKPDYDDAFAIGECSEPPSPISEDSREDAGESGIAQYQKQPGSNGPMRYPSVMTSHSFADDGEVSPLEDEFEHAPVHQVRQSAFVFSEPRRHVSHRAVIENCSDTRDSLSDWSGTTRYVEAEDIEERYPAGRRPSSPYGSPYNSSLRTWHSTKSPEPNGSRARSKTSFEQADGFDEVDLGGPSTKASKPDPARFDAAYKMLTDSSKIEGGKAVKPASNPADLWMI